MLWNTCAQRSSNVFRSLAATLIFSSLPPVFTSSALILSMNTDTLSGTCCVSSYSLILSCRYSWLMTTMANIKVCESTRDRSNRRRIENANSRRIDLFFKNQSTDVCSITMLQIKESMWSVRYAYVLSSFSYVSVKMLFIFWRHVVIMSYDRISSTSLDLYSSPSTNKCA